MIKKFFYILSNINLSKLSIFFMILFLCVIPVLEIFSIGFFGILTTKFLDNSFQLNILNFQILNDSFSFDDLLYFFVFLYFIKTLVLISLNAFIEFFSFNFNYLIKNRILNNIIEKNYEFFLNQKSADLTELINRITGIFTTNILMSLLKLITQSVIFLSIIVFLIFLNKEAVFIIGIIGLLFTIIYVLSFKSLLKRYGSEAAKFSIEATNKINETVYGIKEILTLGLQKLFLDKASMNSKLLSQNLFKSQFLSGLPRFIFEFIIILFLFTYLLIANSNIEKDIATLSMFVFASIRLLPSLTTITKSINDFNYGAYTIDKIYYNLSSNKQNNNKKSKLRINLIKRILLKDVSYNYPGQKKKIFNNLNFEIRTNQFVGIKGKSGSGKSTFLNLLLCLTKSNQGKFVINEHTYFAKDIDKINLTSYKEKILYASQEPLIINETIKKNIILNSKFDHKLFYEVIRKSKIDFFSQKKNIKIGERGIKLSGGQKQKIIIARALYHKKDLLILDETTNSLDIDSENTILRNLNDIKKNKMIIIVSHKKSSFKFCDKVYEFRDNKFYLTNRVK